MKYLVFSRVRPNNLFSVSCARAYTHTRNVDGEVGGVRGQTREAGGRSCKRRLTVEAAQGQKVESRDPEGTLQGAGGLRRSRRKSTFPLSRLLRGVRDSNTQ